MKSQLPSVRLGLGDVTSPGYTDLSGNIDTGTIAAGNELPSAEADPNVTDPIQLPWYQSLYQTALQATGQLNSDGTAAGNGFWTSPVALGLYAVGGIVVLGYLLESPVLAAAIESGRKK
jgi:hypothetical protein